MHPSKGGHTYIRGVMKGGHTYAECLVVSMERCIHVVKEQQVCHIVLSVSVFGFLAQMRTLQRRTPTTTKVVPLSSAALSG